MKRHSFPLILVFILLAFVSCKNSTTITGGLSTTVNILKIQPKVVFPDPAAVNIQGFLGDAVKISEHGRLLALPEWNDGQLIRIFSPESRLKSTTNDWYGEHAGKWMYTTALAANRSGDEQLKSLLLKTANYLVSTQEKDGYLGTYSPDRRITNYDYKSFHTSWDVWTLSYMVLGFLEVNKYYPHETYLSAAKKIGELFLQTFGEGKQNITGYGTRRGISATVILDPIVELYRATGDNRYLELAANVITLMEQKDGLHLISDMLANRDLSTVGDGKAYQLCWNLTAVAKLYQLTGYGDYLKASENAWNNIKNFHLTATGGPWGGIGGHVECFNRNGFWSPSGFLETCSTMSWVQFNREMFRITGEAKYAQELERTAYNALVGAQYPNGIDWCYHSFDNGRTHIARFQMCCPSSGAMALEELSPLIYSLKGNGIACNIYTKSEASLTLTGSNRVRIIQETEYPFEGEIKITLLPEKASPFPLYVRVPDWADRAEVSVNGLRVETTNIKQGEYFTIERTWEDGDEIRINFPFDLKVIHKAEDSNTPRGDSPPISRMHWFSLGRGPLVYSVSGLISGTDPTGTYPLPEIKPETLFTPVPGPEGIKGQAFELRMSGHKPLLMVPYYEAGRRMAGTWRLTWIQNKMDPTLSGEW